MTGSGRSRALACLHSTNKDRYQGSAVALALVQHQNLSRQIFVVEELHSVKHTRLTNPPTCVTRTQTE